MISLEYELPEGLETIQSMTASGTVMYTLERDGYILSLPDDFCVHMREDCLRLMQRIGTEEFSVFFETSLYSKSTPESVIYKDAVALSRQLDRLTPKAL